MKILIVEDDEDLRISFSQLLELEGYEPICACHGQEALDILKNMQELPSLILLDLMMPIMDGFTFRKIQVQDPHLSQIPIVIMTAHRNVDIQKIKTGTSPMVYMQKPVDLDEMISIIHHFSKPLEETASKALPVV
ncbi:MAG: response regulator [Deltaproteobacteria bacterium]|nr:response regulator [Deltaproteobacteria bacterium]